MPRTVRNIATQFIIRKDEKLNLNRCIDFVKTLNNGAMSIFVGTVRDGDVVLMDGGGDPSQRYVKSGVKYIYYDAYQPMVERYLQRICQKTLNDPSQTEEDLLKTRVAIEMRFGSVPLGEASIIICVSSVRRKLSGRMTMSILDLIKSEVPIWKKIVFEDGVEQWDLLEKSEASWMTTIY